jgi:hypothetical protein
VLPDPCPLCGDRRARDAGTVGERGFLACPACGLIFVERERLPTRGEERAHYGTHRNDPADAGYRAFLARLVDELSARLPPGAAGLDYGSGPGPALHLMMEERGFTVRNFDPFFAPDESALGRTYDFIACTEVAEHFSSPAEELARLDALLRPGGWLGVMTEEPPPEAELARWRYARDPTHVAFYGRPTMAWIAARHGWRLHSPRANVFLFEKPATPQQE